MKRLLAVLAAVADVPVRIGNALARDLELSEPGGAGCSEEGRDGVMGWLERVRPEDFA